MLKIYNSLSRSKEVFKPLVRGKVGIYACGVTVYDHCHIGHARSMVCFDVIVRFLRSQGYEVNYIRNITDIDDKIIVRAEERGITIEELTETYIRAMQEDCKALNILPPNQEPRATEHIPTICKLIQSLLDKGYAYQSDNGDVCFEVSKFKNYGKLSQKNLEELEVGSRIEVVKEKRSPLDFVLWKRAKEGEPSWPSAFGDGRPGWHIECSAMSMDALGSHFDIHGGGLDIQFPHHENEIAQSEAASGEHFANYWLHVGMLQVNNQKMSKSLGNFFTIADILKQHNPEVVRYFLLSSHYRSPLNYTEENFQNAYKAVTRLYQTLKEIPAEISAEIDPEWKKKFEAAMNDDFNTPVALSVLFDLSHEINKNKSATLSLSLKQLAATLGLLQDRPESFLQAGVATDDKIVIEQLIAARNEARSQKDWAKADEIRQRLTEKGVELEDGAAGTGWRYIK